MKDDTLSLIWTLFWSYQCLTLWLIVGQLNRKMD